MADHPRTGHAGCVLALLGLLACLPGAAAVTEPDVQAAIPPMCRVQADLLEGNTCGYCGGLTVQVSVVGDNECRHCHHAVQVNVLGDNRCVS